MKTIRKEWPRVRQYVKAGNTTSRWIYAGKRRTHSVICLVPLCPDFIAVAQDYNRDRIYEEAEATWFSVSPEKTKEIAAILKWVGSRLR